jgi:NADP-dependent 3-hydroxy acid dehydrogenase YdfG
MLADGTLSPVKEFKILPILEVQAGMRLLQSGNNYGKIFFEMADDTFVQTTLKTRSTWMLDRNKTYVIAGGTSGLGRAIAEWLVKEKGARNILLLSRSSTRSETAASAVRNLREAGAVVEAPECDITNKSTLHAVLERYQHILPPIAGCIQSSMVLRDRLFANMSYEDWRISTDPKTIGSWNLHSLLPKGMDFFVMLSSISGIIGTAGQANYAAGNTYMDALAHHRNANKEKGTALDFGPTVDQGLLAENPALRDRVVAQGLFAGLSTADIFNLLDYHCSPDAPIGAPEDAQLALGIVSPSQLRVRSADLTHPFLSIPFYRHITTAGPSNPQDPSTSTCTSASTYSHRSSFASAPTYSAFTSVLCTALLSRLIAINPGLQNRIEGTGFDEPMKSFGIDSLLAIELRSWLSKEFAADVPIFEILGEGTLGDLAEKAAKKSALRRGKETVSPFEDGDERRGKKRTYGEIGL